MVYEIVICVKQLAINCKTKSKQTHTHVQLPVFQDYPGAAALPREYWCLPKDNARNIYFILFLFQHVRTVRPHMCIEIKQDKRNAKKAFYFMLAVLRHCWLGGMKGTHLSRLCTHLLVNAADGAVQVHRVGSSVCASCFSRCWCHRHVVRRQHVASAPTSLVTARRRRTTPSTDSLPRPARTTYVRSHFSLELPFATAESGSVAEWLAC